MRIGVIPLTLLLGATASGVFGAMNTFVTVARNDVAIWQSYYVKGAISLGICIAIALLVALGARGIARWTAVCLALAALFPVSVLIEQAPYAWP